MLMGEWMALTDQQQAAYTDAYLITASNVLAGQWKILTDPQREQWRNIYTQRIMDGYPDAAATNMAWSQIAKEIALQAAHQAIGMQLAPARRRSGVPAPCHPDRRHYARSMCRACYDRWRAGNNGVPAACHPDRPNYARTMCRTCYRRDRKRRRAATEASR